jgi:hypothetical protein
MTTTARRSRGWEKARQRAQAQALMDTTRETNRLKGQLDSLVGRESVDQLAESVENGQMEPWERERFWSETLDLIRWIIALLAWTGYVGRVKSA